MPDYTLLEGDCLESLKALADNSVDAVVTDPPYELGFMGKGWDATGIANNPALWSEVLRALKPGGHLASFGGTRTFHRMACAIEDVGFEVRDQLAFCYGTGFPKSRSMRDIGRPELGTALKPAWEPICLARKPLSEKTVAANVLRWGTGAINVGACKIDIVGDRRSPLAADGTTHRQASRAFGFGHKDTAGFDPTQGRFPANLCHDGSDEVLELFPSPPGAGSACGPKFKRPENAIYGKANIGVGTAARHGDSGSAARFFYHAKASKLDRCGSKHPTVKPVKLMQWLCRLICPPGGTILDPFAGSGTTGIAARLEGFRSILCERETEYIADIRYRMDERASQLVAAE